MYVDMRGSGCNLGRRGGKGEGGEKGNE